LRLFPLPPPLRRRRRSTKNNSRPAPKATSPAPEVRNATTPLCTVVAAGRRWMFSGVASPSRMSLRFLRSCSSCSLGLAIALEAPPPIFPPGGPEYFISPSPRVRPGPPASRKRTSPEVPTSPWVLFHAIALFCSFWVVWASHSSVLPKGPLTLQRVVSGPVGVTLKSPSSRRRSRPGPLSLLLLQLFGACCSPPPTSHTQLVCVALPFRAFSIRA